jgi:hypothetical protein
MERSVCFWICNRKKHLISKRKCKGNILVEILKNTVIGIVEAYGILQSGL